MEVSHLPIFTWLICGSSRIRIQVVWPQSSCSKKLSQHNLSYIYIVPAWHTLLTRNNSTYDSGVQNSRNIHDPASCIMSEVYKERILEASLDIIQQKEKEKLKEWKNRLSGRETQEKVSGPTRSRSLK